MQSTRSSLRCPVVNRAMGTRESMHHQGLWQVITDPIVAALFNENRLVIQSGFPARLRQQEGLASQ